MARREGAAGAAPVDEARRIRWLEEGEAALSRLDLVSAAASFERAAAVRHAADAEMGLVRTWMQGGEYRRSLAFVAHTASAHRDDPRGAALYAWLLHAGGQGVAARRLLDEARARFGADPLLASAGEALRAPVPEAPAELLGPPVRVLPYAAATAVPAHARAVAGGAAIEGGRAVVVPRAAAAPRTRFWVRTALGTTVAARVDDTVRDPMLAVLVPARALPVPADATRAPRDPFPGSVGHLVQHAARSDARTAWPLLHAGFVGARASADVPHALGIDVPAGPRGGTVDDAAGRLAGFATDDASGAPRLLPVLWLERLLGARRLPPPADAPPGGRAGGDAIYERALPVAVQVLRA